MHVPSNFLSQSMIAQKSGFEGSKRPTPLIKPSARLGNKRHLFLIGYHSLRFIQPHFFLNLVDLHGRSGAIFAYGPNTFFCRLCSSGRKVTARL
jgi:hypothetical protein